MLKFRQIISGVVTSLSFAMLSSVEAATITDDNLDTNGNVIGVNDIELCSTQTGGTSVICPENPEEVTETIIKNFYNATFALNQFNVLFGDPIQAGFNPSECNTTDPDGLNGLCLWENPTAARLAVAQINTAIQNTNPIPPLIAGEVPIPIPGFPNTREFYRIPHEVNADNSIVSHQGRNTNASDLSNPSWVLPDSLDLNVESPRNPNPPLPDLIYPVTMYAQFNFTRSEIIEPPEPPTPTRVPESSSWLGIIVTGGCLMLTNKKKG